MTDTKQKIKKIIEDNVFIRISDREDLKWIFDFRNVTLTPSFLSLYTKAFFETFPGQKNIQICGLESAAISLVSAIVLESEKNGTALNGFFIRKSVKKTDLFKTIEGVPNEFPVIIVDDILNRGSSTLKQIKILKEKNIKVKAVFSILRFRDKDFYDFLTNEGIEIVSLFELNDFKESLNVENLRAKNENQKPLEIKQIWAKKFGLTTWKHVVPKSGMAHDGKHIYFGTDSGNFNCISALTGETVWTKKVWFGESGKMIFSTPTVYEDLVFFGAYDGNFYALEKDTGKVRWVYSDADWIGSSPCVSVKNKLVYIGLEYGLWKKKGGIAAIDVQTGTEVWKDTHTDFTHCSPFVSDKNDLVFCGSNDGILRIYRSKTGEKLKEHTIGSEIKSSFAENADNTKMSFGAFDGNCYVIDEKTLEIIYKYQTYEAIYSTPVWSGDNLIFASLDKQIYCIDTMTKEKKWDFHSGGRLFSSPNIIGGSLFIGCNNGKVYKINKETGKMEGYIQFTERIVDKIIFNEGKYYVKTFANEVYCITLD
jgi:outer membrane protein assembly factor BamB